MTWPELALEFCFLLACGTFLTMALVQRIPVGVLFFRLMGGAAGLGLLTAAGFLWVRSGDFKDPVLLASLPAILATPFSSRFLKRTPASRARLASWVATVSCAGAMLLSIRTSNPDLVGWRLMIAGISALATGAVAGSIGLAMVLGHWYLIVPKLPVEHLQRVNRLTIYSMIASLISIGVCCLVFREQLAAAEPDLFGPWGLFHLGTRLIVGLLIPLLFAAMAASSLRYANTRSATGILYASSVVTLIGTAMSVSLQASYGIPL